MIHGIGVDIVEIQRITRIFSFYKESFIRRILHPDEYSSIPALHPEVFLASRFAIKEATVKALGSGFTQGITFKNIVTIKENAVPKLLFYGLAKQRCDLFGITVAHISLSHEKSFTVAMVVLEK